MSEVAPPQPDRRRDINTRKVIEVVTAQVVEHIDEKLDQKLRGHVSYPVFVGLLFAFLGLAALVATAIATPAKDKASSVESRQEKLESSVKDDIRALVSAVQKLEVSAAKTEATYRVIVEGVPRATAKAEVPTNSLNR